MLTVGATEIGATAQAMTCHPQAVNIRHPHNVAALKSGAAGDLICLNGASADIKLELHATMVSAALDKLLAAYNVSYRSSVALTETRDGTYKGSLRQVILRLLDGYDFIVARDGANLHVVILARRGEHPIAAPETIKVSENVERPPVHGSREH
jgi:hypothetical protein